MATKTCPNCGKEMNETRSVCPHCGERQNDVTPLDRQRIIGTTDNTNVKNEAAVDEEILNKGISTDAEAVVSDVAETVLWWGNLLSKLFPIVGIIGTIVTFSMTNWTSPSAANDALIMGATTLVYAIVSYFIIKLIAKIIWGIIMLFVNMSTTLKRIEIAVNNLQK